VLVSDLSVRQATAVQLRPLFELREQYRRDFVDAVTSAVVRGNPAHVDDCCRSIAAAQRQLWKLRWDNHYKEVFWRLPLNGLATAERMHMHDSSCVCGAVGGGRRHHFWDCPVARAVVATMERQLPGWFDASLQPQHVLCMKCPVAVGVVGARPLHKGVWRVVCLAAINAMDLGRREACKVSIEQQQQAAQDAAQQQQQQPAPSGQRLITQLLQPAALSASQRQHRDLVRQRRQVQLQQQQQQRQQLAAAKLEEVKRKAVARFWELLQDFVVVRAVPRVWLAQVAPDHPFLRVTGDLVDVHVAASVPGTV
jgi:hypothetical protein